MAAIPDLSAYKSVKRFQTLRIAKVLSNNAGQGTVWHSLWTEGHDAGSAPGAAAACDRNTAGAMPLFNSSGEQFAINFTISAGAANGTQFCTGGTAMLCDRLSHQSGLDGTVTTAQTTNLPTAALGRYTSGVGVMAALEIYSNLGATGRTATISYTNETPTSGRTSQAVAIGGSQKNTGTFIPVPLQTGDKGVTAVASVTLSASTGTGGNFGVTLFRPLAIVPIPQIGLGFHFDGLIGLGGQVPKILTDACLFWVVGFAGLTSATTDGFSPFVANIRVMEGG